MYLHNHKIVHRGISAESLFVSGLGGFWEWIQGVVSGWFLGVDPRSGLGVGSGSGSKEWSRGGFWESSQEWIQGVCPISVLSCVYLHLIYILLLTGCCKSKRLTDH